MKKTTGGKQPVHRIDQSTPHRRLLRDKRGVVSDTLEALEQLQIEIIKDCVKRARIIRVRKPRSCDLARLGA